MDPINILIGLNIIATMGANISASKTLLKNSISKVDVKPKSYLQNIPLNIAALVIILQVAGIFGLGVFDSETISAGDNLLTLRTVAALVYIVFSWLQISAFKTLGKSYSQEVVILKNHELINKKYYKFIRHPQYLFQAISDIASGIALLSYLVFPLALLVEFPLFILRAKLEESILAEKFAGKWQDYKSKTGFFLPFIG